MDDTRFTRLENRMDELKDDVAELKADSKLQREVLKDIKDDLKLYTIEVSSHVAGDNKIIHELAPLLRILPDVISDYSFQKKKQQEREEKIKSYASRFGLVSIILGIVYTATKILGFV
jgi:predicted secreted acid phosphatase